MEKNKDLLTLMMRRMMTIRRFEETVMGLVQGAELVGMAHCYIGEEAVAVGACAALRDDDYITGNHRSHGHPIAKGGDVRKAMAELVGKSTGYCKGKGGSEGRQRGRKAKVKEHKAKVKQTINRAMKNPDPDDIWAAAVGGMMK